MTLSELLEAGRVERVEADTDLAVAKLEEAGRHLRSASVIANEDREGAYALLYDAARKAVDAHLAASGYRISKSKLGAHEATALYARAVIEGEYAEDARALDRMRKQRNRVEYGAWHIGEARLTSDLHHANRIVDAVRAALGL